MGLDLQYVALLPATLERALDPLVFLLTAVVLEGLATIVLATASFWMVYV